MHLTCVVVGHILNRQWDTAESLLGRFAALKAASKHILIYSDTIELKFYSGQQIYRVQVALCSKENVRSRYTNF